MHVVHSRPACPPASAAPASKLAAACRSICSLFRAAACAALPALSRTVIRLLAQCSLVAALSGAFSFSAALASFVLFCSTGRGQDCLCSQGVRLWQVEGCADASQAAPGVSARPAVKGIA